MFLPLDHTHGSTSSPLSLPYASHHHTLISLSLPLLPAASSRLSCPTLSIVPYWLIRLSFDTKSQLMGWYEGSHMYLNASAHQREDDMGIIIGTHRLSPLRYHLHILIAESI
jgi:hypothetical protein